MPEERILIVDDNPTNLKLAAYVLTLANYQVVTAGEATAALRIVRTEPPALILMDIQMPGMDGLTFTKLLKADPTTRDIVIIALTAYAMKGDEEKAIEAGCEGYVAKPLDTRTLAKVVEGALSRKQGANS